MEDSSKIMIEMCQYLMKHPECPMHIKNYVQEKTKEYGNLRSKEYLKQFLLICSSKDIQILQDSLKEVIEQLETKQT